MPTRAEPIANQVADALVRELEKISASLGGTRWLTTPKTVRRGLTINALQAERPAIFVQVDRWSDTPLTSPNHEVRLSLLVHCLADGDEMADVVLNRLASDAVRALTDNETLSGLVTILGPLEYAVNTEATERSGLGIATITVPVLYQWAHGAP